MSQTEVVTVLKVETGNSENTIKSIKKEISDLKKVLESAEIGSEEFAKASKELADAQQRLKTVMDSTKQTVSAAEGSYDALVATMAQLKKEWRATADEAKRNEIGAQIDAINTQLKDLDATVGNHQRNVGNYKGDIIDAYREIKDGSTSAGQAMEGSAVSCTAAMTQLDGAVENVAGSTENYATAWAEMQRSTEVTRAKFESVQKVASGVASGFAALQGVTALLGTENEDLQKILVKVQAAMAIAQGIGGLKGLVEGVSQAKVAFQGATMGMKAMAAETVATNGAIAGTTAAAGAATTAVNGLKAALISSGIGAIVVLIGTAIAAIVTYWEDIVEFFGGGNEEIEKQEKALEEINASYESLSATLDSINDKKVFKDAQAMSDYAKAVKAAGNDVEKLKKAEEDLKKAQEESERLAIGARYEEALVEYEKYYSQREQLAETWDKIEQAYLDAATARANFEMKLAKQKSDNIIAEQEKAEQEAERKRQAAAAKYQSALSEVNSIYERARQSLIDTEQEELAELEKIYKIELAKLKKFKKDTTNLTAEYEANQKAIIQRYADEKIAIDEEARKATIDTKEEELAEVQRIYELQLKEYEKLGVDTKNLTEKFEKDKLDIIKKYGDLELQELNERITKINDATNTNERVISIKYNLEALEIDEFDAIGGIQLQIDKVKELQDVRDKAFEQQMAQIQAVLDAEKEKDLLSAEQEAELLTQYNAIQQEKVLATAEATNQINALNKQMIEQQKADNRQLAKNITTTFTSALSAASDILSAIQEGIDTTNEEGFEKNKKLQIANATIGMLVGITNAMAGAYTSKTGPWDWILAGIQAAAIATVGGIQIANIKKQKYDGSTSGSVGVTPNVNMNGSIPIQYTRELLTDTETTELNKPNKVYVVESDISETQNEVAVKEANSSF